MLKKQHEDGSVSEFYEPNDIVIVTKDDPNGNYEAGDWGRVILRDREDKAKGHSTLISHIGIVTAGYCDPKDCFRQRISSIPVWDVAYLADVKDNITRPKKNEKGKKS